MRIQKIFQIILFILLSLIFTEEDIPIYNLNPFENIEMENQTSSCICFKMSDEIKNGDFFYAIIYTNELYVSINETLRYNYNNSCPETSCNDFEFNHSKECNLSMNEDGFAYQYNFEKKDEKYVVIRYYEFTGKKLKIEYSKVDLNYSFIVLLFIIVGAISLFITIVLSILKICWINRIRNKKGEIDNFIAPLFPQEKYKEINQINT